MSEMLLIWLIVVSLGALGVLISLQCEPWHTYWREAKGAPYKRQHREIVEKDHKISDSQMLICKLHGPVTWESDAHCSRCGDYFANLDTVEAEHCPRCGVRFLPHKKNKNRPYSARPNCPLCARQHVVG